MFFDRKRELEKLLGFVSVEPNLITWMTKFLKGLVRANVLFVDPLNGVVKPQGRLELLAMRKVTGGLG